MATIQHPITEKILLSSTLVPDVAKMITDYATKPLFGIENWKKHFAVDVDEFKPSDEFYKFWYGPDPLDRTQKAYETHLNPVYCPEYVGYDSQKLSYDYCPEYVAYDSPKLSYDLGMLGAIIRFANPRENATQYTFPSSPDIQQNLRVKTKACWLVMRKGVVARNQPHPRQIEFIKHLNATHGAGYEENPSAIHIATAVLTHQVATGERYLGDSNGMEGELTFSRCKEGLTLGAFALKDEAGLGLSGLDISADTHGKSKRIGLACMQRFSV